MYKKAHYTEYTLQDYKFECTTWLLRNNMLQLYPKGDEEACVE